MGESILPGVYIDVRAEGLIAPGRISVNNLGVVGTANKGPLNQPVVLGSFAQARDVFGMYDAWSAGHQLTLMRALELAYAHGASTVIAVRIAGLNQQGNSTAATATYTLKAGNGDNVALLSVASPGTWGNDVQLNVSQSKQDAWVPEEDFTADGNPITLGHKPIKESTRNRVVVTSAATGLTRSLAVVYDDSADHAPKPGNVVINHTTGALTFGDPLANGDTVKASYLVPASAAFLLTVRYGRTDETYVGLDGGTLVQAINAAGSAVVTAASDTTAGFHPDEVPAMSTVTNGRPDFPNFAGGADGADSANPSSYEAGLDLLLNEDAHIMVAAGQDDSFGFALASHCATASTDLLRHDRIGVIGSKIGATLDDIQGHSLDSDRLIFVGPGIQYPDAADPTISTPVTLPGAYAAAAVAGLLASYQPHISPTNKPLQIPGVVPVFVPAELAQLVENRVLAIEKRNGFRIVKGITTATNTAFAQITTRRIVDYAKYGVRSAAEPYIGLLNNVRVRAAMRATINSFLAEMVDDEMLTAYQVEVTATRDDEIKGVAKVNLTLQPTFSIDYIKVTMFLQ